MTATLDGAAPTPEAETPPAPVPTVDPGMARVEISSLAREIVRVPIVGTMPLIVHRFSEKARRAMLDAQQNRKAPKEVRDPEADFRESLYHLGDGYGFPVTAFKAATIGAARFYGKDVKMTELRLFMYFKGQIGQDGQALVPIIGEPRMREDYVRFGMGSTDLRFRGEFPEGWTATLDIMYVTSALSRDSLLSLVEAGGLGGVGEWRPAGKKSSGEFGTYEIDRSRSLEVIEVAR